MKCPKCGHEQQGGLAECQACGVIFAKIGSVLPARRQEREEEEPVEDESGEEAGGRRPATIVALLLAALLLGAALWWLNAPSGLPVPANAYVDKERGYAFSPPSEPWVQVNQQNVQDVLNRYRDRLPAKLQQLVRQIKFDVSFIRIPDEQEYSPSMNIGTQEVKGRLPELNEKEKNVATEQITAHMAKHLDKYRLVSSEIVVIDRIKSLYISSTSSFEIVVTPAQRVRNERGGFSMTEAVRKEFEIKTVQAAIPSAKAVHVFSCSYEVSDKNYSERVCDDALRSFRVLNRPPRFGSITMGALNGGLASALGCVLIFLIGRLTGKNIKFPMMP